MMKVHLRNRATVVALTLLTVVALNGTVQSRPSKTKSGGFQTQTFKRQKNTLSNLDFYLTNKGVLFNNDQVAGLNWPRGTANSYIFGGGLWFATKKNIGGKRRKLVELGYNPNSGAGWYTEGWKNDPDGATGQDSKYISYLSPRYSTTTGAYNGVVNTNVPQPYAHWPIWDTSATKTLKHNYYFGDYIPSEAGRAALIGGAKPNGDKYLPAMLSQEDIVNEYSDQDVTANPEYKQGLGYPFGLNIVEVIYSWSFGRYRDMIFVRHKVTNASTDTLYECFVAPAFDPDLGVGGGAAANDGNSYFGLTHEDTLRAQRVFPKNSPYYKDPTKLNMGYQWSGPESGKQYGVIGFSFLESPATANGVVLDNSDSGAVGGYGPGGTPQLGLTTFKKWTIANDPPTPDLRYDFVSDGSKDHDVTIVGDMRLLFSTGPFTMPPGKTVETTVAIGIAYPSTTDVNLNKDSCVKLINFAHTVFADTSGSYAATNDSTATIVKHFITPVPPDIPQMTTTSLDRAILVQWDNTADSSKDPLSTTLPFNSYDLYRTTRSDHDSTIRPDGINPIVHLGSWSIWNLRQDSIIARDTLVVTSKTSKKDTTIITANFLGFKYTRTNNIPNKIPHSFLDIGDDNNDGVINGSEGLLNGVKYYYFLTATDEYDSLNKVGPLTTAVVQPKNFVVGIPSRPVFPDLPARVASDLNCTTGSWPLAQTPVAGVDSIRLDIVDTGKFLDLYSNDIVGVSFLPRWTEVLNPRFLYLSPLNLFVNVTDTRQGKQLTYDKLYNPNATPPLTPYSTATGIIQEVRGQHLDSNIVGRFTTDNGLFAPNQTVDQAFRVLVDYQFQQVNAPYRLSNIKLVRAGGSNADESTIHLSHRTMQAQPDSPGVDFHNLPEWATIPSFMGSLGECTYEITFGNYTDLNEQEADTLGNLTTITSIKDPNSSVEFHPRVMPIYITSTTHCGASLKPIRPANRNDVVWEGDARFYVVRAPSTDPTIFLPGNSDPDSMIVPEPGKYAVDAYHFAEATAGDPSTSNFILKTTGMFYYPYDANNSSNGQTLATVHRIRLAGAEIMLNYPGITNGAITGDTMSTGSPGSGEFIPGDKIVVGFTGLVRGLPMPDSAFYIYTSKDKIDFASNAYYQEQKILDQVQVVPNPYIVTHLGQTSTDNAKLFFTRLPPRATIEIYTQAGDLVTTLEHHGIGQSTSGTDSLYDRYNVEEWNLLTSGRQRVGSQVLIARVIAKDPNTDAVLGETTKKFAVILGGYRQVTGQ